MEVPSFPSTPQVPQPQTPKKSYTAVLLVVVLLVGLVAGGLIGYSLSYAVMNEKIETVQTQLEAQLQSELENLPPTNATYVSYSYPNTTYLLNDNVSLSQLYGQVQESVVVIRGLIAQRDIFRRVFYTQVQGSGFVAEVNGQVVIVTNNHVVQNTVNNTVTFTDGNGYAATVLGSDPYADLAVLAIDSSPSELKPLEIVSSSSLEAGDPVIAVGSPYGLAGSVTAGIVSALGRTITEDLTGGVPIAGVIQTSTLINPGNSGGPLVNYAGQVVGITTAIVSDSQGLGFAIPSNTILREIRSLVTTGGYDQHPMLDASGIDMTFEIAQAMGTNVTYGWLVLDAAESTGLRGSQIQAVVAGSTMRIGGDIVTGIDGVRITNSDGLLAYLEEYTLPGQTVDLTVVRNNEVITVQATLGKLS